MLYCIEKPPFKRKWWGAGRTQRVVSSKFYIAQILVQSHIELVSSVIALEATEPVTQMAVELINSLLNLEQQKR